MHKIRMILSLLTVSEKRKLIVVFFAMLIAGALEIIGVGSIMPFISVASDPASIKSNKLLNWAFTTFGFTDPQRFVFFLGIAVIGFILVNNLGRTAISYIIHRFSGMRLHWISLRLLRKYLRQPYIFFLNQNSSDLSKNILSEVAVVVNRVLIILLQMISNTVISICIIGLLFFVDPLLALTVSIVLGVSYFVIFGLVRNYLGRKGIERAQVNTDRYKYVYEALGGIKDVKLLGREEVFLDLYAKPSRQYAINDAMSEVVSDVPKYIMETIAFGGILVIILVLMGAGGNLNSILPLVSLYAFGGYRLMPALQKVFKAFAKIKYSFPVVEIVHRHLVGLPDGAARTDVLDIEPLSFKNRMDLESIRFTYPEMSEPVIKDQNLSIDANTSIGFVGPTGCGKTTLVDIVLGLLRPQFGTMKVDGTVISEENLRSWQANLGYVPQTIFLTDSTIARNIAFGIPEDQIDMEAVRKASRIANLDGFIERELEHGYETQVGERGVRLSGGQRQRIGIARAMYHNPSVLILDEATSALDGLTEQAIMDAIHNLSHKKTIIMIAHRITTVRECDVIYVLDHGAIVDRGTYDELIKRNESFRLMAEGSK